MCVNVLNQHVARRGKYLHSYHINDQMPITTNNYYNRLCFKNVVNYRNYKDFS